MPQSIVCVPVHFVFSTRERESALDPAWAGELYAVMGGVLRKKGCVMLAAGGVADHVHLLVAFGRTTDCAKVAGAVKANTSRWVAARSPGFAWQAGYAAFGVGWDGLTRVKAYIANQEKHHRRKSFQDELRSMLRVHGAEWDEGHMWD